MSSDELLSELESRFEEMREDLGFSATLDELDQIFYLRDFVLHTGFVSPQLSRMLAGRIRDTFNMWAGQLHAWVVPNPSSVIGVTESQAFSDDEKEEITAIMRRFISFSSQNTVVGVSKDRQREAKYFDEALRLWNEYKPRLTAFAEKVHEHWKEEAGQ